MRPLLHPFIDKVCLCVCVWVCVCCIVINCLRKPLEISFRFTRVGNAHRSLITDNSVNLDNNCCCCLLFGGRVQCKYVADDSRMAQGRVWHNVVMQGRWCGGGEEGLTSAPARRRMTNSDSDWMRWAWLSAVFGNQDKCWLVWDCMQCNCTHTRAHTHIHS